MSPIFAARRARRCAKNARSQCGLKWRQVLEWWDPRVAAWASVPTQRGWYPCRCLQPKNDVVEVRVGKLFAELVFGHLGHGLADTRSTDPSLKYGGVFSTLRSVGTLNIILSLSCLVISKRPWSFWRRPRLDETRLLIELATEVRPVVACGAP